MRTRPASAPTFSILLRPFTLRPAPALPVMLLLAAALVALATPARAAVTTTTTETFDGPLSEATWRLGTNDTIDSTGGHPGSFLHDPQTDSAIPRPIYVGAIDGKFLGDYAAAGVISLGIDVNIYSASTGVDRSRNISLVLTSDMGTPEDPSDDCDAYIVGGHLPQPGSGWKSFIFHVPSSRQTVPTGWVIRGACGGLTSDEAWKAVIRNVTSVSFPFSDPDLLWYLQIWDIGIDTVRVTSRASSRSPLAPAVPDWSVNP